MELIHVEPTRPKWADLAEVHGITCNYIEAGYLPPVWKSEIEWFGSTESEQGETPREAVVRLIHRLKLTGWQEVTV